MGAGCDRGRGVTGRMSAVCASQLRPVRCGDRGQGQAVTGSGSERMFAVCASQLRPARCGDRL